MNKDKSTFISSIMKQNDLIKITICGSMRYRGLMEKYQAYYTLKGNIVYMPVNYKSISREVETFKNSKEINKEILTNIHRKKIMNSDAILVVNGLGCDYYIGKDTVDEIIFANAMSKIIMFTNVAMDNTNECYFNYNKTYPLYIFKGEEED